MTHVTPATAADVAGALVWSLVTLGLWGAAALIWRTTDRERDIIFIPLSVSVIFFWSAVYCLARVAGLSSQ